MSFFKKIGKIAKGAVKTVGQGVKVVGSATAVVKAVPGLGAAAMLVPGVSQLSAGIDVANSLVGAVNKGGKQAAQARNIIAATKAVASNPNASPAARRAAINGLTLVKKQAAARKTVLKHRVTSQGYVIRVA